MTRITPWVAMCAALLAGCGAEVASTAATTGKLQAQALEQGKAQEAQVKKNLEAAMQSGAGAAAAAADK